MLTVMTNWLTRPNYPLVTAVRLNSTASGTIQTFQLSQRVFLPEREPDEMRTWNIPVSIFMDGSVESQTVWLPDDQNESMLRY